MQEPRPEQAREGERTEEEEGEEGKNKQQMSTKIAKGIVVGMYSEAKKNVLPSATNVTVVKKNTNLEPTNKQKI